MTLLRENALLLLLMLCAGLIGPVGVFASAQPSAQTKIVLVVGPQAAKAVAAVGGKVVGPVQPRFAVLVDGGAALVDLLPDGGVWGVFDATALVAVCRFEGAPDG